MEIRNACINDYNDIDKLFWQSDLYHFTGEPYIYLKTSKSYRSKEYIESLINKKENISKVLENNNKIIGFIFAYEEERGKLPFHRKRKFLVIDNIVIEKGHQNKGYGNILMDYIINYAKAKEYNDIILDVYCFNEKAIKLYKKEGIQGIEARNDIKNKIKMYKTRAVLRLTGLYMLRARWALRGSIRLGRCAPTAHSTHILQGCKPAVCLFALQKRHIQPNVMCNLPNILWVNKIY
jgi:ribosomal protein S18 acetylase RimI-like enzyme